MTDTLHGVILSLVVLNLVNSVLVAISVLMVWRTMSQLEQVCDKIKNMMLVDRRRGSKLDRS